MVFFFFFYFTTRRRNSWTIKKSRFSTREGGGGFIKGIYYRIRDIKINTRNSSPARAKKTAPNKTRGTNHNFKQMIYAATSCKLGVTEKKVYFTAGKKNY